MVVRVAPEAGGDHPKVKFVNGIFPSVMSSVTFIEFLIRLSVAQ